MPRTPIDAKTYFAKTLTQQKTYATIPVPPISGSWTVRSNTVYQLTDATLGKETQTYPVRNRPSGIPRHDATVTATAKIDQAPHGMKPTPDAGPLHKIGYSHSRGYGESGVTFAW